MGKIIPKPKASEVKLVKEEELEEDKKKKHPSPI